MKLVPHTLFFHPSLAIGDIGANVLALIQSPVEPTDPTTWKIQKLGRGKFPLAEIIAMILLWRQIPCTTNTAEQAPLVEGDRVRTSGCLPPAPAANETLKLAGRIRGSLRTFVLFRFPIGGSRLTFGYASGPSAAIDGHSAHARVLPRSASVDAAT